MSHELYVEIVDKNKDLVAGSTEDTIAKAISYVNNQIKTGVAEAGDTVQMWNIYMGVDGRHHWDDLELRYEISELDISRVFGRV